MTTSEWLTAEVSKLATKEEDYKKRAFFEYLTELCEEQGKRIEQAESELDGRLWNPQKW
ncbi:MAG: hypothetical protein ABGA11_01955 [Liquorilactobacillus hordei]|uniref:hypothetical protein n=1 Tax=Liquorilactobacillus hordei TaxID=468911 RepID=UPI0039EC8798